MHLATFLLCCLNGCLTGYTAVHLNSLCDDFSLSFQTTSRRLADRKNQKFQKNVTRRGAVPETTVKKGNDYPVGPVLLGFFVFVVIGSCKLLPSFQLPFIPCLCIFLPLLALFLDLLNNMLHAIIAYGLLML